MSAAIRKLEALCKRFDERSDFQPAFSITFGPGQEYNIGYTVSQEAYAASRDAEGSYREFMGLCGQCIPLLRALGVAIPSESEASFLFWARDQVAHKRHIVPQSAIYGKGEGTVELLTPCDPHPYRTVATALTMFLATHQGTEESVGTRPASPSAPTPAKAVAAEEVVPLEAFSGGEMVFFSERVELCGVTICGGPRSQTRRRILDLLREKQSNGSFVAYSGEELAEKAGLEGGRGTTVGAIRDLRSDIIESLRKEADSEVRTQRCDPQWGTWLSFCRLRNSPRRRPAGDSTHYGHGQRGGCP